jgi:hypothetical protein
MGAVMSEGCLRQNLAEVEQGIASHIEAMPGPAVPRAHCAG